MTFTIAADKKAWLRDHPLELSIVFLTPPFLPSSLQAARVLRLLRLLRLLALLEYAKKLFSLGGLRYAALLAVMTALGGGAALASAENISTWDGVWWSVATMTTVGYGDIYPHTTLGRVIAMGVMVVGIGFLSIIIGAVAQRFVATEVKTDVAEAQEELSVELGEAEADLMGELEGIATRLRELESVVTRLAQQRPASR